MKTRLPFIEDFVDYFYSNRYKFSFNKLKKGQISSNFYKNCTVV